MKLLQVSHRYPDFNDPKYTEHITADLKRSFYEELDAHLAETPGGVLLSQLQVRTRTEDDWLFQTGSYTVTNISATLEDLPIPPEYKLIGGPADGHIIRTQGQAVWLVPYLPRLPSVSSYAEPPGDIPRLVAEYERQGDTAAYFYRRTRNGP